MLARWYLRSTGSFRGDRRDRRLADRPAARRVVRNGPGPGRRPFRHSAGPGSRRLAGVHECYGGLTVQPGARHQPWVPTWTGWSRSRCCRRSRTYRLKGRSLWRPGLARPQPRRSWNQRAQAGRRALCHPRARGPRM